MSITRTSGTLAPFTILQARRLRWHARGASGTGGWRPVVVAEGLSAALRHREQFIARKGGPLGLGPHTMLRPCYARPLRSWPPPPSGRPSSLTHTHTSAFSPHNLNRCSLARGETRCGGARGRYEARRSLINSMSVHYDGCKSPKRPKRPLVRLTAWSQAGPSGRAYWQGRAGWGVPRALAFLLASAVALVLMAGRLSSLSQVRSGRGTVGAWGRQVLACEPPWGLPGSTWALRVGQAHEPAAPAKQVQTGRPPRLLRPATLTRPPTAAATTPAAPPAAPPGVGAGGGLHSGAGAGPGRRAARRPALPQPRAPPAGAHVARVLCHGGRSE